MANQEHTESDSLWFCPGPTTPGGNGSYHPACDLLVDDEAKFDRTGKIILTNFSFPSADAVFNIKNNRVSRQFLREYISFLEVVVLYEELLVVEQPYWVTAEDYQNKDSIINRGFSYFDYAGDANLREKIDELRSTESWIKATTFDLAGRDFDPTIYAAQTQAAMAGGAQNLGHPPHAEDLYEGVFYHGQAFAAFQIAKNLSMPFYGPKIEYHPLVQKQENDEKIVEGRVIARMKERLDSGAQEILNELSNYGYDLQFNTSPIGALIIERSTDPSDMLSIALDLRDKYQPFRRRCQELEKILFDPQRSAREKLKAIGEIERVMNKIWGKKDGGLDRYIKSSGNFVDYALNIQDDGFSVKKITELLVSAPVEYVIDRIRNRKYRLLFDSRDSFLRQAALEAKVAKLFVPDSAKAASVGFEEISCMHFWGTAHDENEQHAHHDINLQYDLPLNSDDDIPF